jgi:CO/xanthine dehydrogenase FAD-binding subunit
VLVDLNRLGELDYMREDDGWLEVGALVRQRAAERDALVGSLCPLLRVALGYVGHVTIRNRGTIGGSLAHADSAAELPAVAVALGAEVRVVSRAAGRWCPAHELFVGPLTTSLVADELIAAVRFPPLPERTACAWAEFAPRHGDFALAGVAAVVTGAEDGTAAAVRLVLAGVGPTPLDVSDAGAPLVGEPFSEEAVAVVAARAASACSPASDLHASADYRRRLVRVLAARALREVAGG